MSTWPETPDGDMVPILSASIQAVQARHPSASGKAPGLLLSVSDRCDACGAAAGYRVAQKPPEGEVVYVVDAPTLDFCVHHFRKNFPPMVAQGWAVIGGNPDLLSALGETS